MKELTFAYLFHAAVISAAEAARCDTVCWQLGHDPARSDTGVFLWQQHGAQHRGCVSDCLDVLRVKATWSIAQQVLLIHGYSGQCQEGSAMNDLTGCLTMQHWPSNGGRHQVVCC